MPSGGRPPRARGEVSGSQSRPGAGRPGRWSSNRGGDRVTQHPEHRSRILEGAGRSHGRRCVCGGWRAPVGSGARGFGKWKWMARLGGRRPHWAAKVIGPWPRGRRGNPLPDNVCSLGRDHWTVCDVTRYSLQQASNIRCRWTFVQTRINVVFMIAMKKRRKYLFISGGRIHPVSLRNSTRAARSSKYKNWERFTENVLNRRKANSESFGSPTLRRGSMQKTYQKVTKMEIWSSLVRASFYGNVVTDNALISAFCNVCQIL